LFAVEVPPLSAVVPRASAGRPRRAFGRAVATTSEPDASDAAPSLERRALGRAGFATVRAGWERSLLVRIGQACDRDGVMAEIAALRALRFDDTDLPFVVAPPYDVIGPSERALFAARSPYNVVHVDLPEGEGDEKYARAAEILASWRRRGVLRRDDRPTLVRYAQTFEPPGGGRSITRRGFFALVRAEPYEARVVLPHERTLSGPKEDRYKLFRATGTALSPVFLLYRDPSGAVARAIDDSGPSVRWESADGVVHELSRVSEESELRTVATALRDAQLLIADGHHRYETTLRYGAAIDEERAARGLPPSPRGAHRYVLSFLCDADDPGLVVFPTHRIVHSLPHFDRNALVDGVRRLFEVVAELRADDVPALLSWLEASGRQGPSLAAVFPDGTAALLRLRADVDLDAHPTLSRRAAVLRRCDVMLLHAGILEPVLGLTAEAQAAQTNLDYYKVASEAVARLRAGGGQVLFLMNATPIEQVRAACEAGEVMPQKSTFFYPKVPTGLVMHVLDPDETIAAS
jgi:uncharacterized protein (DUF1015 family)